MKNVLLQLAINLDIGETAAAIASTSAISSESSQETTTIQDREGHLYDIGSYIARPQIDDCEKEKCLRSSWTPDSTYSFLPQIKGARKRTFQLNWFNRYKWLAYSDIHKGAFCKFCVIFGPFGGTGKGSHQAPGKLVSLPYTNWKDAIEDFEKHSRNEYHKSASVSADNFLQTMSGSIQEIDILLNQQTQEKIKENRKKLEAIIQTIVFCGQQEIALRGHRDWGRLSLEEPNKNEGNFRALLRYRARHGDVILKEHIESSGGKTMYSSPVIQNEIIDIIGSFVQEEIVMRIKHVRYYTVLADETTDVQRTQQFSLCVRYVDIVSFELREDFLAFIPVNDVTGEGLADCIKDNLKKLGLEIKDLRGQGYDGASAMKGAFSGVQARIREEYPLAIYTHCSAHCLNLCLNDSSKVTSIRNAFGIIAEVCNFFRGSPRRTLVLKKLLENSNSKHERLKGYCTTRWVERHEAIEIFSDAFLVVIQALEEIAEQGRDDSSKAEVLHKSICDFKFIIALQISKRLMGLTHALSVFLQAKYVDLCRAMQQVELVSAKISDIRNKSDEEFRVMFGTATEIASSIGVSAEIPRRVGVQTNRENYPSDSPEEYFRRSIFIPYIDDLKSALQDRFKSHKNTVVALQCVVPIFAVKSKFTDLQPALSFYKDDLTENSSALQGEWDLWVLKWKKSATSELPKYAVNTLKECDKEFFPNIYTLLLMLATIPVSTATAERSFSTLKRLKTYLRNSISEDRLNGLALMSVHRSMNIDHEKVIDKFAKKNRNLLLK